MRFGCQLPRVFFEGEGAGGGGTGGGGDDKERRNLQNLLAKKDGDAMALAAQLLAENAALRDDKRQLKADLATAQAKAPAEGAIILTGADATAYAALKELGTADELKALKTERDDFKTKLETEQANNAKTQRQILLRDVAQAAGFKASVLADRDALTPGLAYEIKEIEAEGKKVPTPFVKFKDGEGEAAPVKELALAEFAQQKWADYLPALHAESQQANHAGNAGNNAGRHVAQGSGGGGGGKVVDPTEAYIEKKYQRPDQRNKK